MTLSVLTAPLPVTAAPATPARPAVSSLSPAQQARYKARMEKFNKDAGALRADRTLTPAQKQAKFVTMQKALDTDMLAILTPTQRTQVIKQRQAAQSFDKAHQAEIAQGRALAAKLNSSLTPAQKTQMNAVSEAARAQMTQVASDATLSPEAKQAKAVTIRQDAQAKAMAILTPAQQGDLKQMQALQKQLFAEAAAQSHK